MYIYVYVLFTKVIYAYYKNVNITEICSDDSNHPFKNSFIYLLAVLGLCCCTGFL